MKKILFSLALLLVGSISLAQYNLAGVKVETPVSDFTINDENPLILVKYTGSAISATVDRVTDVFEFFTGTTGSEALESTAALDVNVGDVCGTVNSSLDVSDGDCNTFGELVRVINANTDDHKWVAVLVGALGTETIAGTDFLDPADAVASRIGGVGLYPDSSVHDEIPGLFAPWINRPERDGTYEGKFSIEPFLTRSSAGSGQVQYLKGNPVSGNLIPFVTRFAALQNSDAADLFQIYALTYGPPSGVGGTSFTGGNAHDGVPATRLIYSVTLSDNTLLASSVNFLLSPLFGDPGSILLIRANAATAGALTDTDDELNFHGYYGSLP